MIPAPVFLGLAGWLAAVGFAVTLCLPLGLKFLGIGGASWREVMAFHYPLGLSIPVIALAHAWIPLMSGQLPRVFGLGIALGIAAFVLMIMQCVLGLALYRGNISQPRVRRIHLVTMTLLALVVAMHVGMYV